MTPAQQIKEAESPKEAVDIYTKAVKEAVNLNTLITKGYNSHQFNRLHRLEREQADARETLLERVENAERLHRML